MTPDPGLVAALAEALHDAPWNVTDEGFEEVAAAIAAHPAVARYVEGLRPPGSYLVTRDTLEAALVRAFPVKARVQPAWGLRADVILAALAPKEERR